MVKRSKKLPPWPPPGTDLPDSIEAIEAGEHDGAKKPEKDSDQIEDVWIQWPRCRRCGSMDLKTLRSKNNGDGSWTRRTYCRVCEGRFNVIIE
jgi:hypothetical protein